MGRVDGAGAGLQASTAVFVALQLAHDLLGAAVPPAVLAALAPPAWRQRLLTRLVDLNLIMTVDVTPSQEDAGRAQRGHHRLAA
ncbi:MAG: hypothetical protein HZY76_02055 [Anaerolineae bacterium]|nr:MAG: hypothetical protein HZY76_02055 [Anaerolineae bacterium]